MKSMLRMTALTVVAVSLGVLAGCAGTGSNHLADGSQRGPTRIINGQIVVGGSPVTLLKSSDHASAAQMLTQMPYVTTKGKRR